MVRLYVQTLQCCMVVSKTAARERTLWLCPEIPYCPRIPSLTLTQLAATSNQGVSYVVSQYIHSEW